MGLQQMPGHQQQMSPTGANRFGCPHNSRLLLRRGISTRCPSLSLTGPNTRCGAGAPPSTTCKLPNTPVAFLGLLSWSLYTNIPSNVGFPEQVHQQRIFIWLSLSLCLIGHHGPPTFCVQVHSWTSPIISAMSSLRSYQVAFCPLSFSVQLHSWVFDKTRC